MSKNRKKRKGKKSQPRRMTKGHQPKERNLEPSDVTVEQLLKTTGNWPDKVLIAVGQELHKGRKVTPVLPEEAPEGATYDDMVGIEYAPLDVTAHGFHVTADCRRIGTIEVAGFANSSCKRCYGLGKWKITRTTEAGRDNIGRKIMNNLEYEQTCPCAEKNYKSVHTHFLIDSQYGEWISLDNLKIEKVLEVTVEGITTPQEIADVPTVQESEPDDERDGGEGVPQLSSQGG